MQLSQWGKETHLGGGGTMHAWDLVWLGETDQDVSYIHVSISWATTHMSVHSAQVESVHTAC